MPFLDSRNGPLVLDRDNLTSQFAEGYRALLANIDFSGAVGTVKTIVVTSATSAEGRTTTALNLSIVLAAAGSLVTVVEADLREPGLYEALSQSQGWADAAGPTMGLGAVLAGQARLQDVTLRTPLRNLLVVPAGRAAASPSELLGSPRLRAVLDELSKSSDYVLIDTPPSITYADAMLVARVADGVLYVMRAGTQKSAQARAMKQLSRSGARMLGVVWNDAEVDGRGQSGGWLKSLRRSAPDRQRGPSRASTAERQPGLRRAEGGPMAPRSWSAQWVP